MYVTPPTITVIFFEGKIKYFSVKTSKLYNKILYLDIDIIIKDNIHKVFQVCNQDLLLNQI